MRKFLSTLLLGLVLALPLRADNPVVLQQIAFSSVTTGTSVLVRSTGASEWRIRWVAVSTPATCTVKLEQSEDNSSWSDLIAGQTCTSSGISVFTTGHPLYVRLNVTVLTGGTVNATLLGYISESPTTGAAADGAAVAGSPVLVAGSDGTNAQTLLTTNEGVLVFGQTITGSDGDTNSIAQPFISSTASRKLAVAGFLFNGTLWDRERNNEEVTLLASAARTAQTDSTDQVNYNARGVMIILDITVDAASVGLTPSILMKDPVSGKDVTIWTAAAAATAVGTDIYLIYPGVLAADFNGTEAVSIALPRTWVLRIAVADADEATYSVGASYIQ
jgi:hypothetical protein